MYRIKGLYTFRVSVSLCQWGRFSMTHFSIKVCHREPSPLTHIDTLEFQRETKQPGHITADDFLRSICLLKKQIGKETDQAG